MFDYFKASKFFLKLSVLAVAIISISTLFPFIVGKYSWFRTTIDLAVIFFLLGLLFQDKSSVISRKLSIIFRKPLVIAVSVFVGFFSLACLFGINPAYSFWSNFERGEGGFQMLHLWAFFILLVTLFDEERDWRRLFGWAIGGGVLSGIYGFLAALGVSKTIGPLFGDSGFRFSGSIGNPAYLATFSIFMIFYVLYLLHDLYPDRLKSVKAFVLYVIGIAFIAMFFAAGTRGAFIGLVVAVIAGLFYFIYTRPSMRKWLFIVGFVLVVLVGSLVYFKDTSFIKSIPGSRIFNISFSARTFEDRAIMWKIALDGFKERPVFGWGPENFIQVFDRHFNTNYFHPSEGFGAWFDRAHSVYFDYLVETGLLGLLSFLGIFAVFFRQLFRSAEISSGNISPFVKALLFGLSLAYLIQGIVLFDVLVIYINVFTLLAFAAYLFGRSEAKQP